MSEFAAVWGLSPTPGSSALLLEELVSLPDAEILQEAWAHP